MYKTIEWDEHKAASNFKKHGVRFEVAGRIFDDPLAVSTPDRIENGEQRWQTVGQVQGAVLLLVAHTVRDADNGEEIVRIISARKATRPERKIYENH